MYYCLLLCYLYIISEVVSLKKELYIQKGDLFSVHKYKTGKLSLILENTSAFRHCNVSHLCQVSIALKPHNEAEWIMGKAVNS